MTPTTENMIRLLGPDASPADCHFFAWYLHNCTPVRYELELDDSGIMNTVPAMEEQEWQTTLQMAFSDSIWMNPATGSVAPQREWEIDFHEAEQAQALWAGKSWDDGLIEVVMDDEGNWVEKG